MLQQTRVDTVLRYYDRFLNRFPDVVSLARADHDEVLKHWEGLGYYRRVLNLHRAVQELASDGASIPPTAEGLRQLRGVGLYTSRAVASIAYGERVAAVDGNALRVLARLFHIESDILSHAGRALIGDIAQQLIPADRPGDFNQAWMDFANLVCLPRSPRCGECPLASKCEARLAGAVDRIPLRGTDNDRVIPTVQLAVALIVRRGRVLMRKRPGGGLWSGLWEPPHGEFSGKSGSATLRKVLRDCGVTADSKARTFAQVDHRLTHRRLLLYPSFVEVGPGRTALGPGVYRWVSRSGLSDLPIPTAFHKVFRVVGWSLTGS